MLQFSQKDSQHSTVPLFMKRVLHWQGLHCINIYVINIIIIVLILVVPKQRTFHLRVVMLQRRKSEV